MNKILIISYYFPPLGLGGVQRISKLCKYLKRKNWEPVIVTVKDIQYYRYDTTLLEDLDEIQIFRTGSLDPLRIFHLLKKRKFPDSENKHGKNRIFSFLEKILFIPDSKILWIPFAYLKAARILKKEKIELVLTSSPPNSLHLTGLLLKKFRNVRWIADFRDMWTGGDFFKPLNFIYRKMNRSLEKMIVMNSDYVTCVSKEIFNRYNTFRDKKNTELIYNGYDKEDFPESCAYTNEKIKLTFYGTIHKYSEPLYFVNILNEIIEKNIKLRDKIELNIIGNDFHRNWREKIDKKLKINDIGYIDHSSGIKELIQSDLLLFTLSEKASFGLITGRIFEILGSGIPVLAVIPDIEVKEILEKLKNVHIFNENNKEAVIEFLQNFFKEKVPDLNKEKMWVYNSTAKEYTREKISEKFIDIFNRIKQ